MSKKTMTEGPLGRRMTDQQARLLEDRLKTLPKECRVFKMKGTQAETTETQAAERTEVSVITTDAVDRDGDVVLPKGINRDTYNMNPVVLWSHQLDEPAIGTAVWVKPFASGLKAKTRYGSTPRANDIWTLVQDGILRGKSIGFVPLDIRPATTAELSARPEWKSASIISECMLFEYSVCNVGVNQEALVEAVSKGITTDLLKRLGLNIPQARKALPKRKAQVEDTAFALASMLKALEKRLDPDRIAAEVIRRITERGQV
jgi:HK97 family phage prohead protease